MKTQLIMLPQPILVSNEEIKENDWYYSSQGVLQSTKSYFEDKRGLRTYYLTHELWSFSCQKIIAGIPKLPAIDFSALSEEDCKKIEWIDVNSEWLKFAKKASTLPNFDSVNLSIGFMGGFKAAQSLNEKKFSLEDMKLCWDTAYKEASEFPNRGIYTPNVEFEDFIQSIAKPKVFDVEVEVIMMSDKKGGLKPSNIPKITNNSIKITKVL